METKAVSSADSLSSPAVAKEKELLCQGGNTEASSDSLTPAFKPENICEDTKEKQNSESDISSPSSATSAGATKNTVKDAKQSIDSTSVGLSSVSAVAAGKDEKDVELVAESASSSPGVEMKADSRSVISSQNTASWGYAKGIAYSVSSGSVVLSGETRASEKIIPEVYRFGSSSQSEINASNFQGAIPDSATSDLPAIGPNSADATQGENEGTAILNTEEHEEDCEDNGPRASFYISSSSIPGMGDGSEWPSVSDNYRLPTARPGRSIAPSQKREPRKCLGTLRCHYVIAAVAFLTTFLGCIAYHLSNSGIGPNVLKPIGASTAFISVAVCVISAVYINYLRDSPRLPIVPNYELLGDVDSVMAMNRFSDPEFQYAEDGTCVPRSRTAASEHYIRETQSADVLDRRGYGRHSIESLQTDSKRFSNESGTQPPKKFKAMQSSSGQNVEESNVGQESSGGQDLEESNGGQASSSRHTYEEIPLVTQSSDEYNDSETQPLLPKRRD